MPLKRTPYRPHTFDPRTFGGLRLWLDPRLLSGYREGDEISAWPDRSSQGNHATSSSSGARPTAIASATPTRAWGTSSSWDGTNDRLNLTNDTTGMPSSFFAVATQVNASDFSTRAILVTHVHGLYSEVAVGISNWGMFENNGANSGVALTTTRPPYVLVGVARAFADIDLLTNGANKVNRTNSTGGQSRGASSVGCDPSGAQFLAGTLHEVLWWSVALSNGKRRDVEEYLHRRHVDPPSFSLSAMPDSGP